MIRTKEQIVAWIREDTGQLPTTILAIPGIWLQSNKQKTKEQRLFDRRSNTRARKRYLELNKRGRYKIKGTLHYIHASNDSKVK